MFSCSVDKSNADNTMIGDVYQIDLNSFIPNGTYLVSQYGNRGVLVNAKVDYKTGMTEATFWMDGGTV